jgi:hypothetical protein
MCLIIDKPPKGTMDLETEFRPAVLNNPDGYGYSYVQGDGTLVTHRECGVLDEEDVEELHRFLFEELEDDRVLIHLRYTTAGKTNLRNAHPFPILEYEADGYDVRMAHNGTIHKFKPGYNADNDWESDTRAFVREYVRPLFKRMAVGHTPEDIFSDPFIVALLEDIIPATSVLSFISGCGATVQINALGNGGEYREDGVWVSNKYSFNPTHRKPSTTVYPQRNVGAHQSGTKNTGYTAGIKTNVSQLPVVQGTHQRFIDGKWVKIPSFSKDTEVQMFSKKHGMVNPNEIFLLSDESIDKLVRSEPDDAVLLIKEVLFRQKGLLKEVKEQKQDIQLLVAKGTGTC